MTPDARLLILSMGASVALLPHALTEGREATMRWRSHRRLLPLLTLGVLSLSCGEGRGGGASDGSPPTRAARDELFLASAKIALPPVGTAREDLPNPESEGAFLTERYCTECHALPPPQIHSAADWPPVARRMWLRIEGLDPSYAVPAPSAAERAAMLRYLMEHALLVGRSALPDGPGRDVFASICGRCHELPAIATHPAGEWRPVVVRMGMLMESMLGQPLEPGQVAAIAGYLETPRGAGR